MCDDCVERIAHLIGSLLEEEEVPPDFAFSALHAVGRVVERQFGFTVAEMAEMQFEGREIGEDIAEMMDLPVSRADDEAYRELVADATMKHHRGKPD